MKRTNELTALAILLALGASAGARCDDTPHLGEDPSLLNRVFAPANLVWKTPLFPTPVHAAQPSTDGTAILAFDQTETRAAWLDLGKKSITQLNVFSKSTFTADFTPDTKAGVTHIVVKDATGKVVHQIDEPGAAYLPKPEYGGETTDAYRRAQLAVNVSGTRVAYLHWLRTDENPFVVYDFTAGTRIEVDTVNSDLVPGYGSAPVFMGSGDLLVDGNRLYDLKNRDRYDLPTSITFVAMSADGHSALGFDRESFWHFVSLAPELSDTKQRFSGIYWDSTQPDPIQYSGLVGAKGIEIHADGVGPYGNPPGTPVSISGRDEKSYNWTFTTQIAGQTDVLGEFAVESSPLAFVATAGGAAASRTYAVQVVDVEKLKIAHEPGASSVNGANGANGSGAGLLALGKSDGSIEVYAHAF